MIALVKVKKVLLNIVEVDSLLVWWRPELQVFIFFTLRAGYQVTWMCKSRRSEWNLSCRCMIMWLVNHTLMLPLRQVSIIWVFKLCAVSWEVIVRQQQNSAGQPKPLCHCLFISVSVNILPFFNIVNVCMHLQYSVQARYLVFISMLSSYMSL